MKEKIREALDKAESQQGYFESKKAHEWLRWQNERIEQLEQENAALREEAHAECGDCIIKDHRIEQLEKALEFYADPATYDIDHLSKHGYIIIDKDGGKTARQALGREE